MPERRAPTTEQRAAALVHDAAERAASLARIEADRATALAVDRALKDATFERELDEHRRHLQVVNGSQEKMASALGSLEAHVAKLSEIYERQAAVTEALAVAATAQTTKSAQARMFLLALLAVAIPVLALVVSTGAHP